jgi:hypothetical protein
MIIAIPNGGYRDIKEAARLKKEGVYRGVPDLFIPVAKQGFHGLWIEMKIKPNTLTEAQHKVRQELLNAGYQHYVCYSFDEFMNIVKLYFS